MKLPITDVVSGSVTYYGEIEEAAGTTADPVWHIRKITTTGGVVKTEVPFGPSKKATSFPIFVWDKRAEYAYGTGTDTTVPTLTSVTIASNNSDTTKATVGDVVTVSFTSSESISIPTVTIAGHTAIVTDTGVNTWTATHTMVTGDTTGSVAFSITFSDIAGNAGVPVIATSDSSAVTFDKTAPTAAITYSASNVKSGDTLTITATFSEPMLDSPVVKIAIAGSNTVAATVMTKSTTQIYTYSHTVGAGNGVSTVSLSVGKDTSGNLITSAPTSGATFTVDNVAPIFAGITQASSTSLLVQFSEIVNASSITKANDGGFVVKDTTTGLITYAVSAIAPSGAPTLDEVALTVADFTAEIGAGGVTVTYVAGGNGTVADIAGNILATDATGLATE